jgi:hypothetical protein
MSSSARALSVHTRWLARSAVEVTMRVCPRKQMRNGLKLINFAKNSTMLDDAPWTWGSTGGWCHDMPDFFQGMPNGVYDNIYDDLDDSPVTWHITEVRTCFLCIHYGSLLGLVRLLLSMCRVSCLYGLVRVQ